MRIILPVLSLLTVLLVEPASAQVGFSTPDWSIDEEELSCDLVGSMPQNSSLEKMRVHVPLDHRGASAISLFVPKGSTEAPATYLIGINGHPPLEGDTHWFNGGPIDTPQAWIDLKDRRDLVRAMLAQTPGVMRVGAEVIDLTSLGPAMLSARDCVRKIYQEAGVDMDEYPGSADMMAMQSEVWRKARAEGRSPTKTEMRAFRPIVGPDDYPPKARLRGEEGTVRVALLVSADGDIEHCVVLKSATEALDEATCEAFEKRGKFVPEFNEAGEPIPTLIVSVPIHWLAAG